MSKNKYSGFAIAIAWPQTYCKQPGSWYDSITFKLGINKNHYYKVGHAALVLVNKANGDCFYFDFGRYHSPFQHGRVRGALTDHELELKTKAQINDSSTTITNYEDILKEIQLNEACHGEGQIHASYTEIDFNKAIEKALQMQSESPIAYGPFKYGGSNCSRFVQTAILAGQPKLSNCLKIKYKIPLSPTPMSNVNALKNKTIIKKLLKTVAFKPLTPLPEQRIKATLPKPERAPSIPTSAQWLSGEGAGSWYDIIKNNDNFKVYRYSPIAETECLGDFQYFGSDELPKLYELKFTYPSNCAEISLSNSSKTYQLKRI